VWWQNFVIYLPTVLVPPFAALSIWLFRRRRTRWLTAFLAFGVLSLSAGTFHFAHYFAPFVPLLLLLTILGLRLLDVGRWRRAILAALLIGSAAECMWLLRSEVRSRPERRLVARRPAVESFLKDRGDHIVFVSDTKAEAVLRASWVINRADIDTARVIWAWDLGDEENRKLIQMYSTRRLWRLPIESPLTLQPYTAADASQRPVKFE
jgi:hypothetical protein